MASIRSLLAVLLALLAVTAGGPGLLGTAAATGQPTDEGSTVTVTAVGTAEADPDLAVVNVAVTARADDAEAVRDRIASNASRLRDALADANVSEDRIRTTRFSISREVERHENGTEHVGFRGAQSFEISLSNTSRAGEIVDLAVTNGANRVERVTFTLSEERRRELRAEALREAMANARSDADALAASANLTITGVGSVSTVDSGFSPSLADVAEARAESEPTRIDSGPVTVTADVTVVYNATSA